MLCILSLYVLAEWLRWPCDCEQDEEKSPVSPGTMVLIQEAEEEAINNIFPLHSIYLYIMLFLILIIRTIIICNNVCSIPCTVKPARCRHRIGIGGRDPRVRRQASAGLITYVMHCISM